jgi:hypothetical protein
MRRKEVLWTFIFVAPLALLGCGEVTWGGASVEVMLPDSKARSGGPPPSDQVIDLADAELEPLDLPPFLYWVYGEGGGDAASILPVAAWDEEGWSPLPAPREQANVIARFGQGRLNAGTEFVLFHGGRRAGTFISDGSLVEDASTCLARPRGRGALELRQGMGDESGFLALRRDDWSASELSHSVGADASAADTIPSDELRRQALAAARFTLERGGIPWPPSLPDILRDIRPVVLRDGQPAMGVALSFGGELSTGRVTGSGYGVFFIAGMNEDGGWTPRWSWYQTTRQGKAFPRAVAAGSPRAEEDPLLLLEVFGERDRWLALLGEDATGAWGLRYVDPCGAQIPSGATRSWGS